MACAIQVRWFTHEIPSKRPSPQGNYRPNVTVVVPVKGADDVLPLLVQALSDQEYEPYQLLWVLEDVKDPAWSLLSRAVDVNQKIPSRIITSGISPPSRGQKVHNLITAITLLESEAKDHDVWCFADSDMVPARHWLAGLVAPLQNAARVAVSTGYRWLVPTPSSEGKSPSFWSILASVLNAGTATLQGRPDFTQVWGGSMAIRVETARKARLAERWQRVLSDDFPVTALARESAMRVAFVHYCIVETPVSLTAQRFFNFARRQYLITRIYSPWLWFMAFSFTWLYTAAWLTAWIAFWHLFEIGALRWLYPLSALLLVGMINQYRAFYRRKCVRKLFGYRMLGVLKWPFRLDQWGTSICMVIHGIIVLSTAFGRYTKWGGFQYRLIKPENIQRL